MWLFLCCSDGLLPGFLTQLQTAHQEKSERASNNYLSFLALSPSFPFQNWYLVRIAVQSIVLKVHSQRGFMLLRRGKWLMDPWSISLPSFVLQKPAGHLTWGDCSTANGSDSNWRTDADPWPEKGPRPLHVEGHRTWVQTDPLHCGDYAKMYLWASTL